MGRQQPHNGVFGPEDYNQPTEPLERVVPPVQIPPIYSQQSAVPAQQSTIYTQPEPSPAYPYAAPSHAQVYPVLPPETRYAPETQRPPGGQGRYRRTRRRKSPLPALAGLVFFLIQLILLGRVACMFLSVSATNIWLALLFATSDLLAWPARWLASHLNLSLLAGTQLLVYMEFLVIILAYGLFARLLVRFLKFVMN